MGCFFSFAKRWVILPSGNKTEHLCGKEGDLKQPDVAVWLQELIPVTNISAHFLWLRGVWGPVKASDSEQGGGPEASGSFDVDWCMTGAPVLNIKFSFSPAVLPNHEKGLLQPNTQIIVLEHTKSGR